jgi:hypothetical protein
MLKLGKAFNRQFVIRIPFLSGFYDVGVFFNKKSTFLLFSVDPDFSDDKTFSRNIKVNMFKNVEGSKFCETFLNLHNYRKVNLDIINQFESIKDDFTNDVSFVLNETITLSKVLLEDGRTVYDTLNLYGFTINSYTDEFIFILTERHNIMKRMNKKIVRTSGIQIATGPAIKMLDEYLQESKIYGKEGTDLNRVTGRTGKLIKFSELDGEKVNESN